MNALSRIHSNGKHLLGLISTVLDIAKIESGQFTLNIGEYAIRLSWRQGGNSRHRNNLGSYPWFKRHAERVDFIPGF